jgi:hypothetical protein
MKNVECQEFEDIEELDGKVEEIEYYVLEDDYTQIIRDDWLRG